MGANAAVAPDASTTPAQAVPSAPWTIYRHRLPVRLLHWINAVCFFVMLGSGLAIFNAHPHLYWGQQSDFAHPVFEIVALRGADGQYHGTTRVGTHAFSTDGVLGASRGSDGQSSYRAFPSWATLPGPQSLALGRQWHFTFAWLLAINGSLYLLWTFASRHFGGDLAPTKTDWRGLPRSVLDHILLRHPQGVAATRYNVLQKLAYLAVALVLLPGMVVTGLAMSPNMDSLLGWLVAALGGRQSVRTLHFVCAFGLVAFVAIHLIELLIAGAYNHVRSMLTGWYRVPGGHGDGNDAEGRA
ncbi:MAG: cytochrome b/b6 domain-containing protein [Proteobacteria bacterium]|nr:cytochrome b/b6 domain-containing protein [Pseudomonadota bacterium]